MIKLFSSLLSFYRQVLLPAIKRALLIISAILSLFILSSSLAIAENNQQKQNNIQKRISNASNTLKNSREKSKKLKNNVHFYEDKLNKLSQKLHQTERSINKLTTKLTKSNKEKDKLLKQTNEQKNALAQQMQALYTSGKQSHLRLLLKQNDPSDISRTVKYFEYLNKHRLKRIDLIKKKLDKIKTVQALINKDSESLNKLQEEQSKRKLLLKASVKEKNKAFKKQHKIVYSQEKKLAKLVKEESRLKGVIQKLALKQKREEQKRDAQKQKEKTKAKAVAINTNKNANKKSTKVSKAKEPAKKTVKRHYVSNKPFSSLKGKLSWPVRGAITKRYGSTRNSKQAWKGVIINAPGGTNVHAVARGKVEFSGRLNGYGYLIIIRHDKSYRSLYAYNRSVFKKEGQIVKAGEIIAAVGNSGGRTNTGLYFEIRRGTKHQNPAKWCR